MRYKRYEKYKDSGVEWIGEVPEGWEIIRLKYIGKAIIGLTYTPEDVIDFNVNGILVLRSSNISNNKIIYTDNVYVNKVIPNKLLTREGDILLCSRNGSRELIGKCAYIDSKDTGHTFGVFMTIFRSEYNRFLIYVFNSPMFKYLSGSFLTSTINQLTINNLNSFIIALPPLPIQQSIIEFLDQKTSEIDSLIADKEKLIELLQEQRQAIISEAVTKGLDKNAKMKDSGIEWIGEVPEHWEVSRFRRFCTLQQGLQIAQAERYYEPGEGRYEYITIKSLHSNDEDYIREYIKNPPLRVMCNEEDVLLARTGATGEVITGCNGVFHNNFFKVNYDRKRIIKEYLVIYLKQQSIKSHLQLVAGTTTIPDLNHGDFLDTPFIVPPMEEQKLIIEKVRSELLQVDEAIGIINIQIDRFKEYRQTLISEAVTGKIMV
jgi:type I restriction enzyme S subunit